MRADGIIGLDRPGDQVRPPRIRTLVYMLAVIAVGPAVEAARPNRGDVVGHEVVADFIALVGHRPQLAGRRLPVHAIGVADAAGIDSPGSSRRVDFEDRRPAGLMLHAILADIA